VTFARRDPFSHVNTNCVPSDHHTPRIARTSAGGSSSGRHVSIGSGQSSIAFCASLIANASMSAREPEFVSAAAPICVLRFT
jgi:hypothetical protein